MIECSVILHIEWNRVVRRALRRAPPNIYFSPPNIYFPLTELAVQECCRTYHYSPFWTAGLKLFSSIRHRYGTFDIWYLIFIGISDFWWHSQPENFCFVFATWRSHICDIWLLTFGMWRILLLDSLTLLPTLLHGVFSEENFTWHLEIVIRQIFDIFFDIWHIL